MRVFLCVRVCVCVYMCVGLTTVLVELGPSS